jgi:hypothetical protein
VIIDWRQIRAVVCGRAHPGVCARPHTSFPLGKTNVPFHWSLETRLGWAQSA